MKNSPTKEQCPDNPAVCLFFDETDVVNKDGSGKYTLHVMMKILDNSGKALGEINIPFNSLLTKLNIDFARTIRPDGSVVSLKQEDIRELDIYTGFPVYNNLKVKNFSMPSIEPGCIIEYKATEQVDSPRIEGLFSTLFLFPIGIDILSSTLIVDTPSSLDCKYIMRNLDVKPETFMRDNRKIYIWNMKDIMIERANEPLRPPWR